MKKLTYVLSITTAICSGCLSGDVRRTDRQVYQLIEERQNSVLGVNHESTIEETAVADPESKTREFAVNPRPLDPKMPEGFQTQNLDTAEPEEKQKEEGEPGQVDDEDGETTALIPESIFTKEEEPLVKRFSLRDALSYAARHGRELQDAKEDLYIAALDLTLQRHLWTPQFVASVESSYTNRPRIEDPEHAGVYYPDRAMRTISEIGVHQRLPYGGEVSARVIHTLVREVTDSVSHGDSGQLILEGSLPLLRGAGPTASTHEDLLSSERTMVYAVRNFERFRRQFIVSIASDYFTLQQLKASIANTHNSYENRYKDWVKADFIEKMGQSRTIAEAPRAKANFRDAEASLVSAKERYESALDRFKIRIAMPIETLLDVVEQDKDVLAAIVDKLLPDVTPEQAEETALAYRLDYLNSADRVDDARRGVRIAENRVLPDLDLTGSIASDSDPLHSHPTTIREERTTWSGAITLSVDDRKTERNAYRQSLVGLRRAQRGLEEFRDTVRSDVRRAIRQIHQQENLRSIQESNVQENEHRLEGARQQLELGLSRTNQDVVDAENDLLRAKNQLASAISDYRVAVLDFRLATGSLRLTDTGRWVTDQVPEAFREQVDVDNGG